MTDDVRMSVLEDLRTADRIVAGALATLRYARRQQLFDAVGVMNTEGVFDMQTQRDNASAGSDLMEAEAALRKADEKLKRSVRPQSVSIEHWSLMSDWLGGIFDLIPLMRLNANVETGERLQTAIRRMFIELRASDPSLASVPPLENWDDGPGEIATSWRYNKSAMILVIVVVAGAIAMFVYGALA